MKQKKVEIAVEQNNDFKTTDVKETPFTIVEKNGQIFITIGNQLVSSKKFKTIEEAQKYIRVKPWELLGNVICYLADKISTANVIKEMYNKTESHEN